MKQMEILLAEFRILSDKMNSEGMLETKGDIVSWIKFIVTCSTLDSAFRSEILKYDGEKN